MAAAVAVIPPTRPDVPAMEGAVDDPFDPDEAVAVLRPRDHFVWTAALVRWHAPRAPDGTLGLRRYGRWYSASGRHVRVPLELVLGWVAEDEGMGVAAQALAELVGPKP